MRRRVLFVEANMDGTVGGSYYCLLEIVKRMDRNRFEPLVCFHADNYLVPEFSKLCRTLVLNRRRGLVASKDLPGLYAAVAGKPFARGLVHLFQRGWNFIAHAVPEFLQAVRVLRKHAIDIVHLNNAPSESGWLLASGATKRLCVSHLRGNWNPAPLQKWLLGYYDGVIAISDSVAGYARRQNLNTENFITIHDGIDIGAVERARRRDPGEVRKELMPSSGIGFLVGVVGNLKEWKGQHIAVEAMKIIRERHSDVGCVLVGGVSGLESDRKYHERLQRMVREYGLEDRVVFTGYREDVPDIVSALDVLVHPSTLPEPFGRAILEAMIFSKPVIATAHGGPLDIIEDGVSGLLVLPGDPTAVADKIELLKLHPERAAKLGRNAGTRVASRFAIESNVSSIERFYEALIAVNELAALPGSRNSYSATRKS